ncbi:restriction endonuclease [Luteimonas sp. MC1750]|uniref:restriction endonuclease n=1 Tax=Luteimonas sp. MC1750 TaxID=2799326 RepID=UPI0018F0731B|nr:restriction endonuclease [Luteimonas sp. MC1750]MBJ6984762.1 restriction endonuclease [Luteimonas sp. MC1750]QQO07133.1 restriction endonuclease [Luteimonas sp. MC1750]
MLQWLLAIVATLAVGGAATWFAHGPLRRRHETDAGLAALSAMSWRAFIGIVLEALRRRGYERVVDRESPAGDDDDILVRDGGQWLLRVKHGSAFVLGPPAVNELAATMGVAGAAGGLLVTQGRIDGDARRAARGQPIELLDGNALWPELRPLLPATVVAPISEAARKRARERSLAGWLAALVVGVAVFSLLPAARPASRTGGTPLPAATAPQADNATGTRPAGPVANPDPATLELQRRELAAAVATLPMVARALWSTASTLEVILADSGDDPVAAICPLVERYPALASSRIQLTPPPGSERPVRFRQCRSY